jgi:UDP-3-O-[3-hydroxymyristoyl] glucosamine N-acyltransferase
MFARALAFFHPQKRWAPAGIHETAVVDPEAVVDPSAAIGPLCHVARRARIGKNCQLVSGVFVGDDSVVGDGSLLYPGVRVMHECTIGRRAILHAGVVIGADGFGFAPSSQGAIKIPQVGGVEIGDDVEIGANSTVDRGALGPTRIGHRTKMDNHVQVGHNAQIGDDCILVAATAIAGSSRIGNRVKLAGQVAVVGHIEIGDDTSVGAQSCVMKSCPPGQTLLGFPAQDAMTEKRQEAALRRLPELLKRVKELEDLLADRKHD